MNKKTLAVLLLILLFVIIVFWYFLGKKTYQQVIMAPVSTPTPINMARLMPPPITPRPDEPKNVIFTLLPTTKGVPPTLPIYVAKPLGDMVIIAQALANNLGAAAQPNSGKPPRLWRIRGITITADPDASSLYYSNETIIPQGLEPTIQDAQRVVVRFLNDLSLRQLTESMVVHDSRVVSKNQRAPGATQDETVVGLSYDVSVQRAYPILSIPPLSPVLITTTGTDNTIRSLSLVARSVPGDKIRDAQALSRDQIVDALQGGLARLVSVDPKTGLLTDWNNSPAFSRVSIDRIEVRYAYYPSERIFKPVLALFGSTDTGPRVSYVLSAVQ